MGDGIGRADLSRQIPLRHYSWRIHLPNIVVPGDESLNFGHFTDFRLS